MTPLYLLGRFVCIYLTRRFSYSSKSLCHVYGSPVRTLGRDISGRKCQMRSLLSVTLKHNKKYFIVLRRKVCRLENEKGRRRKLNLHAKLNRWAFWKSLGIGTFHRGGAEGVHQIFHDEYERVCIYIQNLKSFFMYYRFSSPFPKEFWLCSKQSLRFILQSSQKIAWKWYLWNEKIVI